MAALVATVAVCACTAVRLDAVVFDDFESATRTATLWSNKVWYGTGGYRVTNGQATVFVTPATPGSGAFSFLMSRRTWTLQEGRTLEFRGDLHSSNGDGALAVFGFYVESKGAGYNLALDQDTLAFWKHPNPLSCFYYTNDTPVKVSNVKLVVSMTGTNSGVLLKFKILDNDNAGAVLFKGEYLDTVAADPMQRGTDNPPESYLGKSGIFQMYIFRDPGYFDPDVALPLGATAEVVFDNAEVIEYYPPHLEIARATNGVDLFWNLPLEEHIVVAATNVPAPWCPCPQPQTRTNDTFCLTLPCQSPQQFFKLTPGRQFTDDFSSLVPTWTPWLQNAGEEWIVTNGVLQLNWTVPTYPAFILAPLGTNVEAYLRDFYTSVDILDWDHSVTNWSVLALMGRTQMTSPDYGVAYWGGLTVNADGIPGNVEPWVLVSTVGYLRGSPFDMQQIPPPYRLQFSVVDTNISFRVLSLTTGQVIRQMSRNDSNFTQGFVGVWINGRQKDTFSITADNFILSGTKP